MEKEEVDSIKKRIRDNIEKLSQMTIDLILINEQLFAKPPISEEEQKVAVAFKNMLFNICDAKDALYYEIYNKLGGYENGI